MYAIHIYGQMILSENIDDIPNEENHYRRYLDDFCHEYTDKKGWIHYDYNFFEKNDSGEKYCDPAFALFMDWIHPYCQYGSSVSCCLVEDDNKEYTWDYVYFPDKWKVVFPNRQINLI